MTAILMSEKVYKQLNAWEQINSSWMQLLRDPQY